MAERLIWDQEAVGSNPAYSTKCKGEGFVLHFVTPFPGKQACSNRYAEGVHSFLCLRWKSRLSADCSFYRKEAERMEVTVVAGWCICPKCGSRTKTKVNPDTVILRFPLFCPKCKTETVVRYGK